MATKFYTAQVIRDAKKKDERRFRNILANSGEIMESGEIRQIKDLYVMGRDAKLYRVADLNTDPSKQTEEYAVKAQADHGKEAKDGTPTPSVEKQFGSCKVWLEDDGLHARVYFADNDALADHCFAISDDASYSTGIDWFPDGYYGAGVEIDHPIGILREVSMVLTGNDPRAMTLDAKNSKSKGTKGAAAEKDSVKKKTNERTRMPQLDKLTAEERDKLGSELVSVLDKFTSDNSDEDKKSETKDAEGETKDKDNDAETKTEETKSEEEAKTETTTTNDSVKHMPIIVVKDRKEEATQDSVKVTSTNWLYTPEAKRAFADTLKASGGRFNSRFDGLWNAKVAEHTNDSISGLGLPVNVEELFINSIEKADGIISHFSFVNTKGLRINLLEAANDEAGRAKGHKKGQEKAEQSLTNTIRSLYTKMVYKKLSLDAQDLYENPGLIDFRAAELVTNIVKEIERAAIIGDGRSAPTGNNPDYRMFDADENRGFFSIAADASATSGFGTSVASAITGAANLYEGVIKGRSTIKEEGPQYIVAKTSAVEDLLLKTTSNGYFVQPGQRVEDVLQVLRVYTPAWMSNASADAYLIVDNAYQMIGESNIRVRSEFDTSTNKDILLDETPRGGSLAKYKSAAAITLATAKSND